MITVRLAVAAGVALLALTGCARSTSPSLDAQPAVRADRVEMRDSEFIPRVIEVLVGATVTWAFTDGDRAHNVVGTGFESPAQSDGEYSHTFAEAGEYDYRCTLHSAMRGRVIVTDA